MTEKIGAWERKAKICLVDAIKDKEIFLQVLNKLEQENASDAEVLRLCIPQIKHAKSHFDNANEDAFLCMFVWGYETQHYLLFTSPLFQKEDIDAMKEYVKKFIDISIQCCSDGFEINTFNDNNKLLAYAIQATCENEMMQVNLKQYQSK